MAGKNRKFEFDVAISYAGENRDIVEELAALLKTKGLSVFYDVDYRSHLWGKKQSEFERIYGPASRFVIPIISSYYREKDWCRLEFGIAKEEAKKRKEEFLLPIRLDDTRLLGLHEDVIHIDLRRISIPEVVQDLLDKFSESSPKSGRRLSTTESQVHRNKNVQILSHSRRKALGIIAVSPFPLNAEQFEKIFPQVDWKKETRSLRRNGLLERGRGPLRITKSVKRVLLSDPETFHRAWIEALEPLKDHPDTAFNLALQYISLKQFDEAVTVLANIAEGLEPDWWNSLYLTIFKMIDDNGLLRRLMPESRVRFYNATGLCLSRMVENEEAVKWFLKLRRYSKRISNAWGVGQSYINCGVAYYHIGDVVKSERCYRKSIEHARRTNDNWLLGRSLHNLAMTIIDRDLDEAMRFINESLALKESEGDQVGIVGAFMGYGNLAAQKGEILQAIKWYCKAEKKARVFDLRHNLSLTLSNLGTAHVALNKFQGAFGYYREAHRIAEEEGYLDALTLAVQGEATARVRTEEFSQAEALFRELVDLKKRCKDAEGLITALHDVGITLIKQGKSSEARQILGQALGLARQANNLEWVYRCRLSSACSYAEIGNMEEEIRALKRAARDEQKAGMYIVATRLWEACANSLIEHSGRTYEIERAFQKCIECLNKAHNAYHHILRVCKQLFLWRWESGFFQPAIEMLEEVIKVATISHQPKERIHAIDQKGVCFQHLGEFEEAEKAHRQALKLARRIGDKECIETSLNNLGELLRKTGRSEQALTIFIEGESIAHSRQDLESETAIAHNRALALEDLGKNKEAEKLLRVCRDVAKQHKLWDEYVRALHGLANLAWIQGKDRLAERGYAKALAEAINQELLEMKCAISLNYSRLLRTKERYTEAFQILESLQDEFVRLPDSYIYYMTFAELYEDINELESAKTNWEKARQSAIRAAERGMVALCCVALAEIYQKEHKPKLADDELEHAFQDEDDPEGKASILLQRIDVLLDADEEKLAGRIFEKARTLIDEYGFKEFYVDLHMKVGDYNWEKDSFSQFNAIQAYTVAMLKAIEIDIDAFIEVGVYILGRVYGIEANKRIARIDVLSTRLSRWLGKETGETGDDFVINWTLWPLRVARQLSTASQDKSQLSDQIITEIVESELISLAGGNP